MGVDSIKTGVFVGIDDLAAKVETGEFPHQGVLEEGVTPKPVVGGVFVMMSVVELVVLVDGPAGGNPLVQFYVKSSFLRELILHIGL